MWELHAFILFLFFLISSTVRNYHKLEDLKFKTQDLLHCSSGGQKPKMGLTGLKSVFGQGCAPGGSRRESFPWSSSFCGLPACLGSWLPSTSKPAVSCPHISSDSAAAHVTHKDCCDDIEPTWMIQANVPISRSSMNHTCKVPFTTYDEIFKGPRN